MYFTQNIVGQTLSSCQKVHAYWWLNFVVQSFDQLFLNKIFKWFFTLLDKWVEDKWVVEALYAK